ncbi:MAG TPA: hypothetical protein VGM33_01010 [Baekduia sp.]|jgi:hypothetical protein
MKLKTLLPLSVAVAAVVAVPLAGTAAAGGAAPTSATKSTIKIEQAYAFFDSYKPSKKRLVAVVVKTHGRLPRRFDGLIRAGGSLDRSGGGSLASVRGKATHCYTFTVGLRDGRFIDHDDSRGTKASAGSRHVVHISVRDKNAKEITASKTVTLRDKRAGDREGAPIGC